MSKIDLGSIQSGYKSNDALNDNFKKLEDELNGKVLYRDNPDGTANEMKNGLDMNSNRITNLPDAISNTEPATYAQLQAASQIVSNVLATETNVLADGQQQVTFTVDLSFASIYVNGLDIDSSRLVVNQDYTVAGNTIDLVESYPSGTTVTAAVNDASQDNTGYLVYDTIADMKAAVIGEGVTVSTAGYYTAGDGGGATYLVAASQPVDGFGDHVLANGNVALLQSTPSSKNHGCRADDSTDDTAALQALFDRTGEILIDSGIHLVDSAAVVVKSNTSVIGKGIGLSTIKAGSNLALTSTLIENENIPVNRVRQDSNINFSDLTLDGSGRTYFQYPDPSYATKGSMLSLRGVVDPSCTRVEITGHQANGGIADLGCRNLRLMDVVCHDNGKTDDISSPIFTQCYGSVRTITSISKANPAVVTVARGLPTAIVNGGSVWIQDVIGLESVPDGEYSVGNVTATTFELTGIDTSTDTGFVYDCRSLVGNAGNTANFVPSEGFLMSGGSVYDNLRSGLTLSCVGGGTVSGTRFKDNGESTIFSNDARDIIIDDVHIDGTTLTDIAASGIELNYCAGVRISGRIKNTALDGISILGCQDVTVTASLEDIVKDNSLTYPVGPLSVAAGIAGNQVDKTDGINISSLLDTPCFNINILGCTQTDFRLTPQASSCVTLNKAGTNDIVENISIKNCNFAESGLSQANMIQVSAPTVAIEHTIHIERNVGHTSMCPVVQQATVNSTGLQFFDVGFVPSLVEVKATFTNTIHHRTSDTYVARDYVNTGNGSLGYGRRTSLDGVSTSSTVDINADTAVVSQDFYRITDGNGTIRSVAEFAGWVCDSSGIGVNMNVITATDPIQLTLIFYP